MGRCPRGRRRSPPDRWPVAKQSPGLLARRVPDRLQRDLRGQRRRLCRGCRWRRAPPAHASPGRRRAHRLDPRRQEDPLPVLAGDLARSRQALHRDARRRSSGGAAPALGRRGELLARRLATRVHPVLPVAARVEEVPGRPDHADLDRGPVGLAHHQGASHRLQRPLSDVGGRHRLLRLGSQRAVHALCVRHERVCGSRAGAQPRRVRHSLRRGRSGRARVRAARRVAPL